jgi:putative ABC transport system permease protein
LGVGIGDTVTVNVLGRNVTATIANLREVKWETLALNFVMVFTPNTLRGAPHNLLATITLPKDIALAKEAGIARKLGKMFPSISAVRVKDAIDAFNAIFSKIMVAVRVAGGVTLVAGALVLAGALATAQRRRILEAIVLKVIGATRRRILAAHAAEYLLLASATTAFALALGTLASWLAVTQIMGIEFDFSWRAALQALILATGLVLTFGAFGTASVLRARPAAYLKSE